MLILSLDTTTAAGSCALSAEGRVLQEQGSDPTVSQAARLPADLVALLAAHQVRLEDVDAFAVGIGPGSFTGLRVGIATMQGLAVAMEKPLVGVSAFDALDRVARHLLNSRGEADRPRLAAPRVATWIDAWRGEVFAALYEGGQEIEPAGVEPPARLLARYVGTPTLFTGDGAALYRSEIERVLAGDARFADPVVPLLAGAMGSLAADVLAQGHRPLPHAIRPLYVRRSDAELARDRSPA